MNQTLGISAAGLKSLISRKKRTFKLTRGGWVFILYTIGVGAGAINTGNNLLYLVFGLFLGLILASGVLSDVTLWRVVPRLRLPLMGRAGEPLVIPVQVENAKRWFPSLAVTIELEATLRAETIKIETFCPSVEAASQKSLLFQFTPPVRGWFQLTRLKLSTRFPFGLLTKTWNVGEIRPARDYDPLCGVWIAPALLSADIQDVVTGRESTIDEANVPQKGEGSGLHGVRLYNPSDNPRRIHWRASAKRPSGWVVREMERDQDEQVRLLWPPDVSDIGSAELETFVSFAASLAWAFRMRRKNPILVSQFEGRVKTAGDESLDAFLAVIGPDESDYGNASRFLSDRGDPGERDSNLEIDLRKSFEEWKRRSV